METDVADASIEKNSRARSSFYERMLCCDAAQAVAPVRLTTGARRGSQSAATAALRFVESRLLGFCRSDFETTEVWDVTFMHQPDANRLRLSLADVVVRENVPTLPDQFKFNGTASSGGCDEDQISRIVHRGIDRVPGYAL